LTDFISVSSALHLLIGHHIVSSPRWPADWLLNIGQGEFGRHHWKFSDIEWALANYFVEFRRLMRSCQCRSRTREVSRITIYCRYQLIYSAVKLAWRRFRLRHSSLTLKSFDNLDFISARRQAFSDRPFHSNYILVTRSHSSRAISSEPYSAS
jgi:hypothetical protein